MTFAIDVSIAHSSSCDYRIISKNDRYFSFELSGNDFWYGAAHPNHYTDYYTFNLMDGELINFSKISDNPNTFKQFIADYIYNNYGKEEKYSNMPGMDLNNLYNSLNNSSFGIDEENLIVSYGEYSLGSYADGICIFEIPLSKCAIFFNDYGIDIFEINKKDISPIELSEEKYIFSNFVKNNIIPITKWSNLGDATESNNFPVYSNREGLLTAYIDEIKKQMVTITLKDYESSCYWDYEIELYNIENGNVVKKDSITISDRHNELANTYIYYADEYIVIIAEYSAYNYEQVENYNYSTLSLVKINSESLFEDYYAYEINDYTWGSLRRESSGNCTQISNDLNSFTSKVSVKEYNNRLNFSCNGDFIFSHLSNYNFSDDNYDIVCNDKSNIRYYVNNLEKFTPVSGLY